MEGFETYYGNILTEHSHENLPLDEIGRLLALTNNDEVNSLAALHFSELFGRPNVYQLPPTDQGEGLRERPKHLRGRYLFGKDPTFRRLSNRWSAGARIKTTSLTEEFDWNAFRSHHGESAVPLFLVNEAGKIQIITQEMESFEGVGKTLIALVDAGEETGEEQVLETTVGPEREGSDS